MRPAIVLLITAALLAVQYYFGLRKSALLGPSFRVVCPDCSLPTVPWKALQTTCPRESAALLRWSSCGGSGVFSLKNTKKKNWTR